MNIEYALERCREAPFIRNQKRLFAVVLDKRNRVVSEAYNSYVQTHTRMFHYAKRAGTPMKCFLHAEIGALLKDRHCKGVKLIVVRVDSKGKACLAAPCPACMIAIKDYSNIQSVEYSV